MLARLVLGYLIALPAFVPLLAGSIGEGSYTLSLKMSSTTGAVLQVFYDTGCGYSEAQSVMVPVASSDWPREHRLTMPPGSYRSVRIDPGTSAGLYVIERMAVLERDGSTHAEIPLAALRPVHQLRIVSASRGLLVLESPPGSSDPMLVYSPSAPLVLTPRERTGVWLLGRLALFWAGGIALVFAAGRLLRPAAPAFTRTVRAVSAFADARPVWLSSARHSLQTIVSTYPLLFMGRSLVSPNNHGLAMLYEQVPYVPGSTDLGIEDMRGSDVAATILQDVPHSRVPREALAHCEIPLWNRYNALGRPLWGQGLTYFLDPLHWIALVTPDPALGWDLKFVAHRVLFAFGVGLAAFAITGAWQPSAIAAVAAPFAGVFTFRLNHPAVFSLTYAPWILLCWFRLARANDGRARASAAVHLALASSLLLLASTPKERSSRSWVRIPSARWQFCCRPAPRAIAACGCCQPSGPQRHSCF